MNLYSIGGLLIIIGIMINKPDGMIDWISVEMFLLVCGLFLLVLGEWQRCKELK